MKIIRKKIHPIKSCFAGFLQRRTQRPSAKFNRVKGFSIIELLIVLAIFGVITSMILARSGQFNNTVKLKNLAYEIALTIRQAQVFGTSVKGFGGQGFEAGYGVHFGSGNDKSFILFIDLNDSGKGNGKYDPANEMVEVLSMGGGNIISKLCVVSSSGTLVCGSIDKELDIVFKRPSHMAKIETDITGGSYKTAEIYITSPSGEEKKISVQIVGQISVE